MRSAMALIVLCLTAACQTSGGGAAAGFEFALLGDNPYNDVNLGKYRRLIDHVNAAPELAWVVHLGDIKGGQSCADQELVARLALNLEFDPPFILTPGDNDWYDCVRPVMGGFDDFERLNALRRIFYPEPGRVVGAPQLKLRTQADEPGFEAFRENVMWERDGVVFATAHVISATREATDPAAFAGLQRAWLAWLGSVFDQAEASNAAGVFIAMQADPWVFNGLPELLARYCPPCARPRQGLEPLYPLLVERSRAFGRPVVLAVGDTHIYRVDKPLYAADGTLVENFTRVEAFGHPYVHWVRVAVNPRDAQVFSFRQELVPANLGNVAP